LPSGHENFHENAVVVTLWMFLGLSVRKSGPAFWHVSYAISLWYQSKRANFNCCCTLQGLHCIGKQHLFPNVQLYQQNWVKLVPTEKWTMDKIMLNCIQFSWWRPMT